MYLVISSLAKAFGQLADPPILRVLAKCVLITLAVFIALAFALAAVLPALLDSYLDFSGEVYAIVSTLIALVLAWFLFRVIAIAVLQFFADDIVAAVEARHYPEAASRARKLPFREDLSNSLSGIGRTLAVNALALPVALLLLFTAIGAAIIFLLVNAVLLGRELTDMGWLRHRENPAQATPVTASERLFLGAAIAGLMLIPILNILAPVIGAAAGTHLVQRKLALIHD